jgi:DNA-binding response OmpR family regulator
MSGIDTDAPQARAWLPLWRHVPPRILVAEDDDAMRHIIVETLQRQGFSVSEAPDGGRLLVMLARGYMRRDGADLVDLLVSDVRMPICTGLQILEQLRAVHCQMPTILITAFGDEATRQRAGLLGALLLDKPFHMGELQAAVANLLKRPAR